MAASLIICLGNSSAGYLVDQGGLFEPLFAASAARTAMPMIGLLLTRVWLRDQLFALGSLKRGTWWVRGT